MNLYEVTFKRYSNSHPETYGIVARNAAAAIERTLVVFSKRHYHTKPHEILTVTKLREIDGVQK